MFLLELLLIHRPVPHEGIILVLPVKKLMVSGIVVLLALDWLALDDLTTGNEPDKRQEVAMVMVSVPLLILIGKELLASRSRDKIHS